MQDNRNQHWTGLLPRSSSDNSCTPCADRPPYSTDPRQAQKVWHWLCNSMDRVNLIVLNRLDQGGVGREFKVQTKRGRMACSIRANTQELAICAAAVISQSQLLRQGRKKED